MRRILAAAGLMLALAGQAHAANDWLNFATVSMTDPNTAKLTDRSFCYSDGRDIACDNTGQYISTGGLINAGALQTSGYVSAGTIHTSGTVKVSNTAYIDNLVVNGTAITGNGITGSGSATAVAYWSGTSRLTYDADGFYWEPLNNRLGIGTNAPAYSLDVSGSLRFKAGLGGQIYSYSGTANGLNGDFLMFQQSALGIDTGVHFRGGSAGTFDWNIYGEGWSNALVFKGDGSELARFSQVGNFGLGTQSPTATLQVSGSLIVSVTGQTTTPTLYVGPNGRVGIGTSAPGAELEISDSTPTMYFSNGTNTHFIGGSGSSFYVIAVSSTSSLILGTSNTGRINIRASGNVGISRSLAIATLDVEGTISASDAIQVGTSSLSCSAGIPGAIRYNAGNLQYCNGTTWITVSGGAGVTGSGSATAVAYWSGASGLTYDTDGFYWDATNNRLGIGTGSTINDVTIRQGADNQVTGGLAVMQSDGSNRSVFFQGSDDKGYLFNWGGRGFEFYSGPTIQAMSIAGNGMVGINNGSPAFELDVSGTIRVAGGGNPLPSMILDNTNGGASLANYIYFSKNGTEKWALGTDVGTAGSGNFFIHDYTAAATRFYIAPTTGNVGIGTTAPTAKLEVAGHVELSGATSNTISWGSTGAAAPGAGSAGLKLQLYSGTPGTMVATDHAIGVESNTTWYNTSSIHKWYAASVQKMLLDGAGNLSVTGTISASNAIQVSGSSLTCSAALKGALRYSNTNSSIEYCQGTAWTGLTGVGGATSAAGATGDVQFNSGGALAADSGDFTYVGTTLKAPIVDWGSGRTETRNDASVSGTRSGFYESSAPVNYPTGATGWWHLLETRHSNISNNYSMQIAGSFGDQNIYFRKTAGVGTTAWSRFIVENSAGRTGIGTTTPGAKLDVVGTISASEAIEVGSSSLTCGAHISGAIRFESTSNTIQVCAGASGWKSLVSGTAGNANVAGATGDIQFNTGGALAADTGQLFWDATTNELGIGTGTPGAPLHVSASAVWFGGTGASALELGGQSVGNQYSFIDLVGDDTYTDYGLRILRGNTGPNAGTNIFHRGTGGLFLITQEPAAIGFQTSSTTRMTVTADGDVGIGTASPATRLDVQSPDTGVRVNGWLDLSSGQCGLGMVGNNVYFNNIDNVIKAANTHAGVGATAIQFNTCGAGTNNMVFWRYSGATTANSNLSMTESMRIDSSGKVGIGTSAPTAKLEVAGHVELSGPTSNTISWGTTGVAAPGAGSVGMKLQLFGATPGTMAAGDYTIGIEGSTMWFNTTSAYKWYANSVQKMLLDASGNLTIPGTMEAYAYAHPSDRNLKADIATITSSTELLENLRGTHFRWKADNKPAYGVIAQEVQEILPELVTKGDGHLRVDYDQLVPVLIEGWKAHQKTIGALKAANDNLEAANDNQEKAIQGLEQRLRKLETGGAAR